jgi:predicted DNA-binding transcriptional regulator YafY
MARTDRLLRLLQAMRVMSPPITAARLAEETGVSLRALYRDIDSLRGAGAQIDGERGYGYRLIEDHTLPPQTLDRIEIEALVLGLAEVRQMGDPALAKAASSALAKVAASLTGEGEEQLMHAISQVYRPDGRMPSSVDMNMIRQACWREQSIALTYADKLGNITQRIILPLGIVYAERVLTVLAWCCLREAFRMFRADRIIDAGLAGASFRPRRAVLLRTYLAELKSLPA